MAREQFRERNWKVPNKRTEDFVSELRSKNHMHGAKEGKKLTDYEAGFRSGYLLNQSDRAGFYKYIQAIGAGKSKSEAKRLSKIIGKHR